MKRFVALITAFLLLSALPVAAQNVTAKVIPTCGTETIPLTPGNSWIRINQQGQLCVSASVSASITGFPTVQSTGTPISVTTSSATGTLPAGAVVVASNVGATNGAYCKLGATATVSDQLIPPNSWFAFTVGANTQLSCITSTSTTTVNMVGGSGLPTGSGGGGGGAGGSSAITSWGGGTLGAMANYGTSPGAVLVPGVNAFITNTNANGQAVMASSSPVVIASNQTANALWGHGATGSAVPANAQYGGALDAVGGTNLVGIAADPCQTSVKTTLPITLATAAVKVIAVGVSAKKIYVCQLYLNNNAADSVAIFEATTATTCATSPIAVVGAGTSVATAATGNNWAANGGLSQGNGAAQVLATTVNNNDLCVAQSAATQLTGSITYVTR